MMLPHPFSDRTPFVVRPAADQDPSASPFVRRGKVAPHRPDTGDPQDFRQQADGAP